MVWDSDSPVHCAMWEVLTPVFPTMYILAFSGDNSAHARKVLETVSFIKTVSSASKGTPSDSLDTITTGTPLSLTLLPRPTAWSRLFQTNKLCISFQEGF